MSDIHEDYDREVEESLTDESEGEDVDLEAIHEKFSVLAAALQETNQNLVTFEMLQDHYRNVSKAAPTPNTSLQPAAAGGGESQDVDIVDLLKDICGSVNQLKTEMGTVGQSGKINLEEIESKLKYPQKFAELSEKASKIEVECGFYKNQCQTLEEKYMEEKRKNSHLEDLIRSREDEIRQLNSYLKDAEVFSKNLKQENMFLQKQLGESTAQLEQEKASKELLKLELDRQLDQAKGECEVGQGESKTHDEEQPKKTKLPAGRGEESGGELELELELPGQSARSTLSSAEGGYEEKYKELRESRNRLKQKTKLLLRQYRGKRSQLERKERQLAVQRSGLLKLQTLHQSVESNHCIVIHHLGQQIQQIANLVSSLWPGEDLSCLGDSDKLDKLSEWIVRIDSLSGWTISKLVKVSLGRRDRGREGGEHSASLAVERTTIRAAAIKCELGIVDEGMTVQRMISGLEEADEAEVTDKQVGTWM